MKQLFKLAFAVCIAAAILAPAMVSANDFCEDSTGPLAVGSLTTGSTADATLDEPPDIDCGTSVTAPGVWYTVTGTGNTMTASTCNDGDPGTGGANYDTKISVYCADCEVNECIGGLDDDISNCSGFTTKFDWPTMAGATYSVLVHGFGTSTGDFELAILDDGAPVPPGAANDCDGIATEFDFCPGTVIPESAPTKDFGPNRSALTDASGIFETAGPNPQGREYTIEDTAGCSCEQIVDILDLGNGHLKHGCSFSAMDDWLTVLEEQSCGNCVEAHGGLGCEQSECEAAVCAIDSFCCGAFWDGLCADEALGICVPDICIPLAAVVPVP
jgi:hypothetical protein